MQPCPSDFSLDDLEIHGGAAPPEIAAHLGSCPRCAARQAARVARKEEFRAEIAPAVWRTIERRGARAWWRWALPALALASVAPVVLVARPWRDQATYVGVKGAPSVEIYYRRGAETARLASWASLVPGDQLRFSAAGAAPSDVRYVLIGSVDGSGRYWPFYPARFDQESVPLPPPGGFLPDAIEIDATPGAERLLTVWSAQPIRAGAVAPIAERAAARLDPIYEIAGIRVTSAWRVLPKAAQPNRAGN